MANPDDPIFLHVIYNRLQVLVREVKNHKTGDIFLLIHALAHAFVEKLYAEGMQTDKDHDRWNTYTHATLTFLRVVDDCFRRESTWSHENPETV